MSAPVALASGQPAGVSAAGGDLVVLEAPAGGASMAAALKQGALSLPLTDGAAGGPAGDFVPLGQPWRLFFPPLPTLDDVTLSVSRVDDGALLLQLTLAALPDFYWAETFTLRGLLPAPWSCGAKSAAALPALT